MGTLEICEWEQWFDENELAAIMSEFCSEVNIVHDVNYEGYFKEGLFSVWQEEYGIRVTEDILKGLLEIHPVTFWYVPFICLG